MMTIRTVSLTIVLVALSFGLAITSARAIPEGQNIVSTVSTVTPLLSNILSNVNTIGDDNFATVDLTTFVDSSTTAAPTQHYGPYASGSPDSGTCSNYWADDTFDRHFTVFTHSSGIIIVEQFKDGNFSTPSAGSIEFGTPPSPQPNPSPGACENSLVPQGTVNNGVTGSLHGYFIIPLPSGSVQTSQSPYCNAVGASGGTNTDCSTTGFIDSHFTPCYGAGVCSANTFFDHYVAPAQGLIENEWKNASADRGGNSGDIRSTNV